MEKIKICIEVYGLHNGGIEKVFENYFSHMDYSKYDLHLLTHMDSESNREKVFRKMGFEIHQLDPVIGHKVTVKNIYQYISFFKKYKFDIVHTNCPENLLTLFFSKINNTKVRILHVHNDYDAIFSNKNIIFKKIVKIALKINILFSNQYMACGMRAAESVFGTNNLKKVFILNNAFKIDNFSYDEKIRNEIRKKYNLEKSFVLGHIGRFEGLQKNQEYVIDIYMELRKICTNSKLIMIGDGPKREQIMLKVRNNNVQNDVIFTGVVNNVNEFLQAIDFFIFPSRWEGLSVTTLEAQASGLHGIISNILSKEMNVLGFFEELSIDEEPKVWARKCLESSKYERENGSEKLKALGYDIYIEAQKLDKLYLELVNKVEHIQRYD